MIDISIVIPTIRPQNLIKVYQSILKACKRHEFEVIFASPYLIPQELMLKGNVRFIHTYASPSVAAQMSFTLCAGNYTYHSTDDGLFQEDVIDLSLDLLKNDTNHINFINMIYIEDSLNLDLTPKVENPKPFPDSYWLAKTYPNYHLPGIDLSWKLAPHFLIYTNYLFWLGGIDTSMSYINQNLHDFAFRAQAAGSQITNSPKTAFLCSHIPNRELDHFAVHDSNEVDNVIFNQIYSKPDAVKNRIRIPIDNWRLQPQIWERRFKNGLKLQP